MINLQFSARVDLVRPEKFRTFCTAEICTGERAGRERPFLRSRARHTKCLHRGAANHGSCALKFDRVETSCLHSFCVRTDPCVRYLILWPLYLRILYPMELTGWLSILP